MLRDRKCRIALVDDHRMVREWLSFLIAREEDLEVCGEAGDLGQGVELIQRVVPDLAIVDLTLKGADGLELIKTLKASAVPSPILVFSMHDESVYAQRAVRAGASGYLTKDAEPQDVITAIRRVLDGGIYFSPRMVDLQASKGAFKAQPVDRLSDRELYVFKRLGRGQSSRRIAEEMQVGLATVETYRARIKEKLKVRDSTELLHFAIEWGRTEE